ncbi:hypothetical protein T484DRAFT_1754273, partial [Baffinella frigidus]
MACRAPIAGAAAAAAEEGAPAHPPATEDAVGGGADFEMQEEAPASLPRQTKRRSNQQKKPGEQEDSQADFHRPGTLQYGLHRAVTTGAGKELQVPECRLVRCCRAYGKWMPSPAGVDGDQDPFGEDDELASHPLAQSTSEACSSRAFGGMLDRQEATAHEKDWAAVENFALLCYPKSKFAALIRLWEEAGNGGPGSKKGQDFPEGCVFRPVPKMIVQAMMLVYTGARGERKTFDDGTGKDVTVVNRGTSWANVKHFQGALNFIHAGFGVRHLSPCKTEPLSLKPHTSDGDWASMQQEQYNMHSTAHNEALDPVEHLPLLYSALREMSGWSYLMMLQIWAIFLLCISL